jgi:hypothetical protein
MHLCYSVYLAKVLRHRVLQTRTEYGIEFFHGAVDATLRGSIYLLLKQAQSCLHKTSNLEGHTESYIPGAVSILQCLLIIKYKKRLPVSVRDQTSTSCIHLVIKKSTIFSRFE